MVASKGSNFALEIDCDLVKGLWWIWTLYYLNFQAELQDLAPDEDEEEVEAVKKIQSPPKVNAN